MRLSITTQNRLVVATMVIATGLAAWVGVWALPFSLALCGAAAYWQHAVTRSLRAALGDIVTAADEVQGATHQVESGSRSLAEGASTQAASIEETSASLEEMSSMTAQNADNAGQANAMANETRKLAMDSERSMGEMVQAMEEIGQAASRIAGVIKLIDEIAFQTNLLALNAAVEAARAGEHGKGFAVVAEEVRSLATRSAAAAKDTGALIDDSITKAHHGQEIAAEASSALGQMVSNIQKLSQLMEEISLASKEQAQGVAQLNSAVTQIDRITQQNAAQASHAAENNAALQAGTGRITDHVAHLAGLIDRDGAAHRLAVRPAPPMKAARSSTAIRNGRPSPTMAPVAAPRPVRPAARQRPVPPSGSTQPARAAELFPLGEDDDLVEGF